MFSYKNLSSQEQTMLIEQLASFNNHIATLGSWFDPFSPQCYSSKQEAIRKVKSAQSIWHTLYPYVQLTSESGFDLTQAILDDWKNHKSYRDQTILDLPRVIGKLEIASTTPGEVAQKPTRLQTHEDYITALSRVLHYCSDKDARSKQLITEFDQIKQHLTDTDSVADFFKKNRGQQPSLFDHILDACNQSTQSHFHTHVHEYVREIWPDCVCAEDADQDRRYVLSVDRHSGCNDCILMLSLPMRVFSSDARQELCSFTEHMVIRIGLGYGHAMSAKGYLGQVSLNQVHDYGHLHASFKSRFNGLSDEVNDYLSRMITELESQDPNRSFLFNLWSKLWKILSLLPILSRFASPVRSSHESTVCARCSFFASSIARDTNQLCDPLS